MRSHPKMFLISSKEFFIKNIPLLFTFLTRAQNKPELLLISPDHFS